MSTARKTKSNWIAPNVYEVVWTLVGSSESDITGSPDQISAAESIVVQVSKDGGGGINVTLEGSNDGITWTTLKDDEDNDVVFSDVGQVALGKTQRPLYIRPRYSVEGSATATVTLVASAFTKHGRTGAQGPTGPEGTSAFDFLFSTSTDPHTPLAAGRVAFDNANVNAAVQLMFPASLSDHLGAAIANVWNSSNNGFLIKLQKKSDPTVVAMFHGDGSWALDDTARLGGTGAAPTNAPFANGDELYVFFLADKGDIGAAGATGATGPGGVAGTLSDGTTTYPISTTTPGAFLLGRSNTSPSVIGPIAAPLPAFEINPGLTVGVALNNNLAISDATLVVVSTTTDDDNCHITGIAGGVGGRVVTFLIDPTKDFGVAFDPEDSHSDEANRIHVSGDGSSVVSLAGNAAGGGANRNKAVSFIYSSTIQRWVKVDAVV